MNLADLKRLLPNASNDCLSLNAPSAGSPAKLERPASDEPLEANQTQGADSGRFLVRITSVRRRLLDEDNLASKYHTDLCRYAGILPSDAPGVARIETTQRKAAKGEEEHTQIEVFKVIE